MKKIFLIGYMGTGKTTAGRRLAEELGLTFYDLDHYIEARYQQTITHIFESMGEERFREIEAEMLHEVGEFERVVVATGGGTPCFFSNMEYMNKQGTTVYLKASPEALTKRLMNCKPNKRPLITGKSETELLNFISDSLEKREPFYSQAQVVFETEYFENKSQVDEYVKRIISFL